METNPGLLRRLPGLISEQLATTAAFDRAGVEGSLFFFGGGAAIPGLAPLSLSSDDCSVNCYARQNLLRRFGPEQEI